MIPIAPIISNVLGLGIPLIVDLVNRSKGKKKARQLSAKSVDVLSKVQMGVGAIAGGADLGLTEGHLLPPDVELWPDWVRYAYFGTLVAGFVLKFIAKEMTKLADQTEDLTN